MKRTFTILVAIILTANMFAQSPGKVSYQAVIRDASDNLVTNQAVGMQISILQGSESGTAVYVETQTPTTNANGLVSIEIGAGIVVTGDFSAIDWANGPYFIKTETDPAGSTSYTITGTSQLLSVPYALHAKTAESFTGTITETDPVFVAWDKDYDDLSNTPTTITTAQSDAIMANSGKDTTGIFHANRIALELVSGTNTGDQDISGIATNTQAIKDTAAQIRDDIPDVSGFLTSETDPNVPTGTQTGQMQYWNGTAWVTVSSGIEGQVLTFKDGVPRWATVLGIWFFNFINVYNPSTGKIWMDRNLGAFQVATSSTDDAAYGYLYQWGRPTDGHQRRTSGMTSTLSSTNNPGHSNFILAPSSPCDWRSPQNTNLWQGVNSVNNPCPEGYRLPTEAELDEERASWSSNNLEGAFASPLKLPLPGMRFCDGGTLYEVGYHGYYWSSTVDGIYSRYLFFYSTDAKMESFWRASGFSVRCIKD